LPEVDYHNFLDHVGALNNSFEADLTISDFIEKILELGEITDVVERLYKLEQSLPTYDDGVPHPLYWITLMFLEQNGLIERQTHVGGLAEFELTVPGVLVLQSLRDRRVGYN
jgi:hypothetical protein